MEWFHIIFTNKSLEKRVHPPPLKPKRIRHKEEKRERKLQRRAEKGEKDLQVPPEQRLLEDRAKRVEEMADWDLRWAEVGASQAGKPEEDKLVNPSLFPNSSDSLSHKEFFETSEDETSEDAEENSFKSSHLTPSTVSSKGQRIRHKEERRERKRQKKGREKGTRETTLSNSYSSPKSKRRGS